MSPKQAADELGVCLNKIYDLIGEGLLKARKMGTRTIILRSDLEACANALPVLDPRNNPARPTCRNLNPVGRRKRASEAVA
jgi:excisionase family DNA binding protein